MDPAENRDTRQREIVDQSEDVRDPADDSGEIDDPATMTDTYPVAFEERIEEAAAAIDRHSALDDRRTEGGN
jgi:hypothetical protein